jgi:hypothetical protein
VRLNSWVCRKSPTTTGAPSNNSFAKVALSTPASKPKPSVSFTDQVCQTDLIWPLGSSVPHSVDAVTCTTAAMVATSSQTDLPLPSTSASPAASASRLSPPSLVADKTKLIQAVQGLSAAVAPKKEEPSKTGGGRRVSAGSILQRGAQGAMGLPTVLGTSSTWMLVSDDLDTFGQVSDRKKCPNN